MNKLYLIFLMFLSIVSFYSYGQNRPETAGERQYYDSAHYSIILGDYISGERFLKCYMNKKTSLDSWTTYYKNGQIKEQGQMTNRNHIYVGKWKYYKETGELDSIVDYDNKFPISYFNAIEIAKTKDFPTRDISESTYKSVSYWQFVRWRKNDKGHGRTGDVLLVNKQTGEIIIPDDLIITGSH